MTRLVRGKLGMRVARRPRRARSSSSVRSWLLAAADAGRQGRLAQDWHYQQPKRGTGRRSSGGWSLSAVGRAGRDSSPLTRSDPASAREPPRRSAGPGCGPGSPVVPGLGLGGRSLDWHKSTVIAYDKLAKTTFSVSDVRRRLAQKSAPEARAWLDARRACGGTPRDAAAPDERCAQRRPCTGAADSRDAHLPPHCAPQRCARAPNAPRASDERRDKAARLQMAWRTARTGGRKEGCARVC